MQDEGRKTKDVRRPFVFSVADLRHERSDPKPVELREPVEWHLDLSRVLPDPPLHASLVLTPASGGIFVTGTLLAHVTHSCHRCLDAWDDTIDLSLAQLYLDQGYGDETDYVIDGWKIDLEPMLRDEVLLALPLAPICGDDCTGVVEAGESGLNTQTPGVEGASSSPFAVLRDLFDEGE